MAVKALKSWHIFLCLLGKGPCMGSVNPLCDPDKSEYEECFNNWFQKRSSGKIEYKCEELFEKYRKCIQKTLENRKIDKLVNRKISSK